MVTVWYFSNFGAILTQRNWSNVGFLGIFWRTHWDNGRKFCMLMYPDHLQNCLDYGYSLLIFLILVLFWLSETGQIWGFQACGRALWIFLIMMTLSLKLVIFRVSGHYLVNICFKSHYHIYTNYDVLISASACVTIYMQCFIHNWW